MGGGTSLPFVLFADCRCIFALSLVSGLTLSRPPPHLLHPLHASVHLLNLCTASLRVRAPELTRVAAPTVNRLDFGRGGGADRLLAFPYDLLILLLLLDIQSVAPDAKLTPTPTTPSFSLSAPREASAGLMTASVTHEFFAARRGCDARRPLSLATIGEVVRASHCCGDNQQQEQPPAVGRRRRRFRLICG